MKRFLTVFLTFVGAYFLYAEGLPYEIPPGVYYVWEQSVNIHDEPSFDSTVIGTLGRDDAFTVLGSYNEAEWYRIETAGGLYGYVYGQYIAIKRDALDIDENGIMDYFYVTYSVWGHSDENNNWTNEVTLSSIYVFINNEKNLTMKCFGMMYGG